MKTLFRSLIYFLLAGCLVAISYLLYVVQQADFSATIPTEMTCLTDNPFDFEVALNGLDLTKLNAAFPYEAYLASSDYCNAAAIENSLKKLNQLNPNQPEENSDILISALTNKLEARVEERFKNFNADSLIMIQQWVDEFFTYEKVKLENAAVYGIIYEHWMGFIAKQLGEHYDRQPAIKFRFKFKYLQSICQSKRFSPAVGKSNLEKVIDYSLGQEYGYLLNRLWNGTGFLIKLVFLLLFVIFLYLLYCTYQYNFKKQIL
ncbi:MAG: hypothetical protein AB8G15_03765 [Saprospiraceae bacterium]